MSGAEDEKKSPVAGECDSTDQATAKKLISPKSRNFFVYTNVPTVEDNRVCPICHDEAPTGETHRPHYGGICCFSCRAFFRRAHQRTKNPRLVCKRDGNCQILAKEKHLCKKCRYNKCLSVGMNAKWVLSNEEKRVRFEKFFKKKDGDVSKPNEKNSDSPKRSKKSANEGTSSGKGSKRRPSREDDNNLSSRRKMECTQTSPISELSSSEESLSDSKSSQLGHNLMPVNQCHSSCFGASAVVESRSSQPNLNSVQNNFEICSMGIPQPINLFNTPQYFDQIRSLKQGQAMYPEFERPFMNARFPGGLQSFTNLQLDLARRHEEKSVGTLCKPYRTYVAEESRLNPERSQPDYGLSTFEQRKGSLDYRSNLHYTDYNAQIDFGNESSRRDDGLVQISKYANSNNISGPTWNGPSLSSHIPDHPDRIDSHANKPEEGYYVQNSYPSRWLSTENPFSTKKVDTIATIKQATHQKLLQHLDEAKSKSHFVLNVSGTQFLIQKLPNDQDGNYNFPGQENRVSRQPHPETVYLKPLGEDNCQSQTVGVASSRILSSSHQPILGRLSTVLDSFSIISSKGIFDPMRVNDLVANHLRSSPLQKSTFISHSTTIAKMMTEFAMSQFVFMSLDSSDKLTLLKHNVPLYVQYILARYFFAKTGRDQIAWILNGQVPILSIEDFTKLQRISFTEYNRTVNFIPLSDHSLMYSHHIENIGLFYPYPENCNGLVANMLLYHTDETIIGKLKEPKRISCIYEDAKELIVQGRKFLDPNLNNEVSNNLHPLISTLAKMKNIFEDCCISSTGSSDLLHSLVKKTFPVSYTDTEESWLKRQFQLFHDEFYSVAPMKRYLEELISLQLHNSQVSDDHVQLFIQMSNERMRRVMKIHQEFNNLKGKDQEIILHRNVKVGLALTIARLNLYQSGKDQLRAAMGFLGDNNDWESQYNWTFNLKELKKARLDQNEVHLGKISPEFMDLFNSLFRDVSELVPNDELYTIFTLISMLDTNGLPENEGISEIFQMRQIYLKLFQRRLSANGFPPLTYDRFKQILSKLLQFAEIMTAVFDFSTD